MQRILANLDRFPGNGNRYKAIKGEYPILRVTSVGISLRKPEACTTPPISLHQQSETAMAELLRQTCKRLVEVLNLLEKTELLFKIFVDLLRRILASVV